MKALNPVLVLSAILMLSSAPALAESTAASEPAKKSGLGEKRDGACETTFTSTVATSDAPVPAAATGRGELTGGNRAAGMARNL